MLSYKESNLSKPERITSVGSDSDSVCDCSFSGDEDISDNNDRIVKEFLILDAAANAEETERLVWQMSNSLRDICGWSCPPQQIDYCDISDRLVSIVLNRVLSLSTRIGATSALSVLVRLGADDLCSSLLDRKVIPEIYDMMGECTVEHHIVRILEFFSEFAAVDENMSTIILEYFNIGSILENISNYDESNMISRGFCQLLRIITFYHSSEEMTISIINFIKQIVFEIEDSFIWENCSAMLCRFCELDSNFKEYLKDDDTFDLVTRLLKKGTTKVIQNIVHLIILLGNDFDISFLNFSLILSRLSNLNPMSSKDYFILIQYAIETSEELLYHLLKCKLFNILMETFQESNVEIRGYSLKILTSITERCCSNLLNQIVKKGFVPELVHLFELENKDFSIDIIRIFLRLFSDCNDAGVIILLKQQFIENNGIEYLESITKCDYDKELFDISNSLLKLIESIDIDMFEDNGEYLFDSDNDI